MPCIGSGLYECEIGNLNGAIGESAVGVSVWNGKDEVRPILHWGQQDFYIVGLIVVLVLKLGVPLFYLRQFLDKSQFFFFRIKIVQLLRFLLRYLPCG